MDFTTRLSMNKPNPDPVTGDPVDIAKLNENFDKIDSGIGATICTSSTRPIAPFEGQFIRETDTGRLYLCTNASGPSWTQILISAAAAGAFLSHIESQRPNTFDSAIRSKLAADANYRMNLRADGRLEIGDGTTAADVNLYRRSANHLGTDDSFQSGGFCSGAATESVRTTNFPGITTEVVVQSVSFNAISGAGYMIYADQHYQSSVVNDIIRTRLRYAAGGTVTTAGTLLKIVNPNCAVANRGDLVSISKLFVAPSTGQFTIGVTMERVGTGTGQAYGEPNQAYNTITVVGA